MSSGAEDGPAERSSVAPVIILFAAVAMDPPATGSGAILAAPVSSGAIG